ncbi:alpha/beta fold hydrolase [Solirubrobacter sp. CPCC 204708]|nr:alpha/beta fold hydrolase [Solirubrobacter deserti]
MTSVVGAGERFASVGEVELCYETFGSPSDPALLLIMGMGFQLVHWPDAFCASLAGHGFFVVRFDNRDAGRSTHVDAPYGLEDMADDAVGLLDALGVSAAHVAGASLGAMIAQVVAVRHPSRVLSLASLMSTTGARGVGRTSPRVFLAALRRSRDAGERRVRMFSVIGSTRFEQDVDWIRRVSRVAAARDPQGRAGRRRQHRAVRRAGDRTGSLRAISCPTVVIHGSADVMCAPSGGRATADAIPGARFELIDGLGHDLPPGAWPRIIEAIVANAR